MRNEKDFPRAEAARSAKLRGAFAFPLSADNRVNGVIELFTPDVVQPDDDLLQLSEALGSQVGLFIHRKDVEAELQRQKDAAEAANAAKDRFLANLSHELRTPLTPVLMWAGSMLLESDLPAHLREDLQMVQRNISLEARLIDDLLDLTRISRGKVTLNLEPTGVHEVLRHAIQIVAQQTPPQLRFDVRLEAARAIVLADSARLQQVFWNILSNACKFSDPPSVITITSCNRADTLRIEITDHGIGIEPHDLERIFDEFRQVGTRREGLGLGLAISKAIIEMHAGKIAADSAGIGKGATFTVELPLRSSG